MILRVPIDDLVIDQTVQLRARWLDQSTVQEYVVAMTNGSTFPPVVAFSDNGTLWLADGFHRVAAAKFLGRTEIEADVRTGSMQVAKVHAASANAINGKPMSRDEKQEAGKRLIKLTSWSDREIARKLALNNGTVSKWRQALSVEKSTDTTEQVTVTRGGSTYTMDTSNIGKGKDAEPESEPWVEEPDTTSPGLWWGPDGPASVELPSTIRLIHGEFAEIALQLPPGSISTIITDPPYSKKYLYLYAELADHAERLLKPGGSVLAMAGQSWIPDILSVMLPYLKYHWLISYDTPGGQSPQIFPRKVNSFWKPVLWLTKGDYDGAWHGDKIKSDVNDNDKRYHEWGQSLSGITRLVSEFAFDGTVLDPFMGGGTTAVACYQQHKPFIGIDADVAAVETARQRILSEVASRGE